jgi:hypothetical protein
MLGLIILIIALIILISYYKKSNIIEGYDARYTNTTFAECAEFCKTTSNCWGFGYDKSNNICYPSQTIISGQPLDSLYKDEYTYENAFCNKVNAIEDPNSNPSFVDRRANAVYACTETYGKQPSYYLHDKGTMTNIGAGRNIDGIFNVEFYEVRPYKWPRNRFDYDQLDLLMKERENQLYTPQNITDVDRLATHPVPETTIIPQFNKTLLPDFDIKTVGDNISNTIKNLFKSSPQSVVTPETPTTSFKENDEYNTGAYLNDYKCASGVALNSCLQYCSGSTGCIGFEWNPSFDKNTNVCCPYATMGTFVPRDPSKSSGRFYQKTLTYNNNKQNNAIIT